MTLEEARKKIDAADSALIQAFLDRMDVSAEIAAYKAAHGLPVRDEAREQAKLAAVREQAGPVFGTYAERLYKELFACSREYQTDLNFQREHPNGQGLRCGLLGEKLGHSYSPRLHKQLGAYDYTLFEVPEEKLPSFFQKREFDGINVTVPYKVKAMEYCDSLSDAAREIGCVNVILRREDGTLHGDNVDWQGFAEEVKRSGVETAGKKAVVLGSGGGSKAVCYALKKLGVETIAIISRSGPDNYENLSLHRDAQLVINATPVGMFPQPENAPVDLRQFPACEAVFDLIYNPARTMLGLQAERLGIPYFNGTRMLAEQAKLSAGLFLHGQLPGADAAKLSRELELGQKNIILIGMPGCGKTTIGKSLSALTGRQLLDCDDLFRDWTGTEIPDYLRVYGEESFRNQESIILEELSQVSGSVIATGGGCVTRAENRALLRRNGTVIWLQRDLALLPTEGRPLSQAGSLEDLYALREPMYRDFCDLIIENNRTPAETAEAVWEAIQ